MIRKMDRREFLKQGAMTAAALSVSPQIALTRQAGEKVPTTVARVDAATVRKFASQLQGQVLRPGDRNYLSACRDWTGQIPVRPALLVRCASTEDVVASVHFARENDILPAVRGGGHGLRATDGGMLIDLSRMKKMEVNRSRRTVRSEPGVTVRELDRATRAFGHAAVLGECPSVGISGYTLGGGLGRLMGEHGAAVDNLVSAQIISADGTLLRASSMENEDLFWAIRGGGGNFGIVTSFEYRIHPVGDVLAGTLVYPISIAEIVFRFFDDYMTTAPDHLDALIQIGKGTLLYAPNRSVPTVAITVCCGGNLRTAEQVLRPLRTFRSPMADTIRRMSYFEAQLLENLQPLIDHATPEYSGYFKQGFVTRLGADVIDAVIRHCEKPVGVSWSVAFDHYMHGAVCRVPEGDMAFSLRLNGYSFRITSFEKGERVPAASVEWGGSLHRGLEPFSGGRMYLNYLGDEGNEGVRAALGSNYARLLALKKTFDPTNFFRFNPNIEPA